MPELVKMYIRNVAIGFVVAAIFVGLLLGFDVSGLRGLIFGSDAGLLALGMIWFVNGIVFARLCRRAVRLGRDVNGGKGTAHSAWRSACHAGSGAGQGSRREDQAPVLNDTDRTMRKAAPRGGLFVAARTTSQPCGVLFPRTC